MARGWASKSVEAQIDAAKEHHHSSAIFDNTPPPEALERLRKRESILLSRIRVERDLKSAQNPRYKALLTKTLAELDAQLATFAD
jgi:hypothetical protein